ncbi:MAG: type 1 glutamine amidotransferase-like domain-containing protein [Clostridia bacterium]|nr:type 1 glutamine amidotransferase-like domain-containing protein [Clostridia bacterium]
MKLYLSSQKFGNKIEILKKWIKEHNNKILLIFNALDAKGEEKINFNVKEDTELLQEIGFDVKVVDLKNYFKDNKRLIQDFSEYNACCVMGGNVFVLRQAMEYSGFDKFLYEKSLDNDFLYIGYSAGSCVLGKDIKIFDTIDNPIKFYEKDRILYNGLGFIDYIFIPHYKSNYHKVNLIEELAERCKSENKNFKAVKDGEVITK